MDPRNCPEKWHINKTIGISHILTTISAILAVIFFINDFDDRIDLLEFRSAAHEKMIVEDRKYVESLFKQIREDLGYIRQRIDGRERAIYEKGSRSE